MANTLLQQYEDLWYKQRLATKITSGSLEERKDVVGFTDPNLHRRIDSSRIIKPYVEKDLSSNLMNCYCKAQYTVDQEDPYFELAPRKYQLGIFGLNSYRQVEIIHHEERSTRFETP